MAFIDDLPPGVTASMQRDIMEGRPSELVWQHGAVVRLGRKVGVATPVHSFICGFLVCSRISFLLQFSNSSQFFLVDLHLSWTFFGIPQAEV